MIALEQVEAMIKSELPNSMVQVQDLGGGNHLQAIVVSPEFEGKTRVKQHQMVYRAVKEAMDTEVIHALALKTYTPLEWEQANQVA